MHRGPCPTGEREAGFAIDCMKAFDKSNDGFERFLFLVPSDGRSKLKPSDLSLEV